MLFLITKLRDFYLHLLISSLCVSLIPLLSPSLPHPLPSPLSLPLSLRGVFTLIVILLLLLFTLVGGGFTLFFYEEQGNVGLGSIYIADNFVVNLYLTKYGEYIS